MKIYLFIKIASYPIKYMIKKLKMILNNDQKIVKMEKNKSYREKYDINLAIQQRMREEENAPKFEVISDSVSEDEFSLPKHRYSRSKEALKKLCVFVILYIYNPLKKRTHSYYMYLHDEKLQNDEKLKNNNKSRNSNYKIRLQNDKNENKNKNTSIFKVPYSCFSSCINVFKYCMCICGKKQSKVYDVEKSENSVSIISIGNNEDTEDIPGDFILHVYIYICPYMYINMFLYIMRTCSFILLSLHVRIL